MSYYSSRLRTFIFNEGAHFEFPCVLDVSATLSPSDAFGVSAPDEPRSFMFGTAEMKIDFESGRLLINNGPSIPPIHFETLTPAGELKLSGKSLRLLATVSSHEEAGLCVDYLCVTLGIYLSIQLGQFVDPRHVEGKLGSERFSVYYPTGFIAHVTNLSVEVRDVALREALAWPNVTVPGYSRFVRAGAYFHHALRLTSAQMVNFPEQLVIAEAVLNYSKCLEILAGSSVRDAQRAFFSKVGYSSSQIESQIIPILVMRNALDVAHPVGARLDQKSVDLLGNYATRARQNTRAVLGRVRAKLQTDPNLLSEIDTESDSAKLRLISRLSDYLAAPHLEFEGALQ